MLLRLFTILIFQKLPRKISLEMLFSKILQHFSCLRFIGNYIAQKPYRHLTDFDNTVLFKFLNMYNLIFSEKTLHHQLYQKKWQTTENDLAIAIKLMHKYLHYIIFVFQ